MPTETAAVNLNRVTLQEESLSQRLPELLLLLHAGWWWWWGRGGGGETHTAAARERGGQGAGLKRHEKGCCLQVQLGNVLVERTRGGGGGGRATSQPHRSDVVIKFIHDNGM